MKQQELFRPIGGAEIVGRHRYSLSRIWSDTKPQILFIGLNPSTATDNKNDPTITRVQNFADDWGYGGFWMGNLFSYITAYPDELVANMGQARDHTTDERLKEMIDRCATIVCAWGSWKFVDDRVDEVLDMIHQPYCLGFNKDGSPKHPLYLSRSKTKILPYVR